LTDYQDTIIREIIATSTPDGQATIRLDHREFSVERRTEVAAGDVAGLCPVELIGISFAS